MNGLARGVAIGTVLTTPFWLAAAWASTRIDVTYVADRIAVIAWYGRWPYGAIGLILAAACLADVYLNPHQED